MGIELDHLNIETQKLSETIEFYQQVLGLEIGYRPDFGIPGAWLYADGERPVIHLVEKHNDATDTGVINHLAFKCEGLEKTKAHLARLNIPYQESQIDEVGVTQLFILDPNGVRLELNIYRGH